MVARRAVLHGDGFTLPLLVLLALGVGELSVHAPQWAPPASVALVVLVGGFVLSVRSLVLLLVVAAAVISWQVHELGLAEERPGSIIVVAATAAIVLAVARARAQVGVAGLRGESMLVDLRDRLRAQGELPTLPAGWSAEVVLRPAGGASFSGDFLVATAAPGQQNLELVLCDVSGKGVDAGTRALLLSGALSGLLGAMPVTQFLPAANQYLLRQGWQDGFATAVHVALDLASGDFTVLNAGHPPPVQFVAGSGTWHLLEGHGTALGVDPSAAYPEHHGQLARGDALLLYSDGVVEQPGRDIDVGIDRLVGQAERLVTRGFSRGARRLVDTGRTGASDDRALVLLWRG